ncbi:Gfo/Idh/MocA family protein [Paradesertivirga mongoliensis]|uniref:Gfo/Idh/MocA family protein n=1 Tax=Paradesertivirga mongoliensis TaxID=2100740 RepID=A0ABW4ZPA1_9SPHI|nr:Gfo/Idh/MocA family oxidoreductase [Pedobacter mongoliensis]
MKKVRWGILSTAKIGLEKVVPAMQAGEYCEISAIASRDRTQAEMAATRLNIPKFYGTYEELLADSDIDAIYIPLPNHLHIPWTIKALEAGKHVLCEKPIGLSSAEAQGLLERSKGFPHLKVMEAFMYRFHPQWLFVKKLIDDKRIGDVRTIQAFFSYFNDDPQNIRNKKDIGGGGLMDIGCYCISQSRFILSQEPVRVFGMLEYDEKMGVDRMASAIMDFGNTSSTFTCSTQLAPFQNFRVFGTKGLIDVEIPVNIPPHKATHVWLELNGKREEFVIEAQNQYTLQGEFFSKAILNNTSVPTPLEDAVNNMKVIEAIKESNLQGSWVMV